MIQQQHLTVGHSTDRHHINFDVVLSFQHCGVSCEAHTHSDLAGQMFKTMPSDERVLRLEDATKRTNFSSDMCSCNISAADEYICIAEDTHEGCSRCALFDRTR